MYGSADTWYMGEEEDTVQPHPQNGTGKVLPELFGSTLLRPILAVHLVISSLEH
jgi:hypothetical protein